MSILSHLQHLIQTLAGKNGEQIKSAFRNDQVIRQYLAPKVIDQDTLDSLELRVEVGYPPEEYKNILDNFKNQNNDFEESSLVDRVDIIQPMIDNQMMQ